MGMYSPTPIIAQPRSSANRCFIEVAIAPLVEQRVSTLCEAGSNPVIALKFFTEVLCIISVMEEIPASLTKPSSAHQCTPVVLNYSCCGVAVVMLGLNWYVLFYLRFHVSQ